MSEQHGRTAIPNHRNRRDRGREEIRGFSLIELMAVIIIISILLVLAIQRLLALQVDAERVVMESTAGAIRAGIGIKVAEKIVKQKVNDLAMLESSNPMNLLAEVPRNYLGELDASTDPTLLEKGNWYFDTTSRTLIYLVDNTGYFTGGAINPPRARFKIRLVYTDSNANDVFDSGIDSIEGVHLATLESYKWMK